MSESTKESKLDKIMRDLIKELTEIETKEDIKIMEKAVDSIGDLQEILSEKRFKFYEGISLKSEYISIKIELNKHNLGDSSVSIDCYSDMEPSERLKVLMYAAHGLKKTISLVHESLKERGLLCGWINKAGERK